MKQLKQFLDINCEAVGLSKISISNTDHSTLRNSFSEFINTERSIITDRNDQSIETQRNKINQQLTILQSSLIKGTKNKNLKRRRVKYSKESVQNSKPKEVSITSKELHQIRKFDQQLYQAYLNLYHEYKLQTKMNEQKENTLEKFKIELQQEKQREKQLISQLNAIECEKENAEKELKKSQQVLVNKMRVSILRDANRF